MCICILRSTIKWHEEFGRWWLGYLDNHGAMYNICRSPERSENHFYETLWIQIVALNPSLFWNSVWLDGLSIIVSRETSPVLLSPKIKPRRHYCMANGVAIVYQLQSLAQSRGHGALNARSPDHSHEYIVQDGLVCQGLLDLRLWPWPDLRWSPLSPFASLLFSRRSCR